MPDERPVSLVERLVYPEWGPIVAGAIAAAALALVLHAFGLAIGLSVSSAAPTWRDASFALILLSGLYVVLAALASYGFGGYLAGLMRVRPPLARMPTCAMDCTVFWCGRSLPCLLH